MEDIKTTSILHFCRDEVNRQGYDMNNREGFDKVVCMLKAWNYALNRHYLDVHDISTLGNMVEPNKNHSLLEFRKCNVKVGGYIAPPPNVVYGMIANLSHNMYSMTPDEAYLEFQRIHPFVDGNGRVGKIIHNFLNKTLHDPILIKDYFGGGNP